MCTCIWFVSVQGVHLSYVRLLSVFPISFFRIPSKHYVHRNNAVLILSVQSRCVLLVFSSICLPFYSGDILISLLQV